MYLLGVGLKKGMAEGENFWVMLINILYSFSRPSVLAQIGKLDQTEGNFLAPGWRACC